MTEQCLSIWRAPLADPLRLAAAARLNRPLPSPTRPSEETARAVQSPAGKIRARRIATPLSTLPRGRAMLSLCRPLPRRKPGQAMIPVPPADVPQNLAERQRQNCEERQARRVDGSPSWWRWNGLPASQSILPNTVIEKSRPPDAGTWPQRSCAEYTSRITWPAPVDHI